MIFRPRCQVVITVTTSAATSNGSQPPSTILARLALRKMSSTPPNTTAPSTSFHVAHRHAMAANMRNSVVLMTRVPVTATP